jgi:hypothetical protein
MPLSTTNVPHRLRATCAFAILLIAATARAASVSWDGPALGGNWTVATNWSTNAVPTAADDVTISGATVGVSDARVVAGLTLANDGRLVVSGIGASLGVTGPANVDDGLLVAMDFGHIDLPTVTSITRTQCAGSIPIVELIMATSGGTVNLSGLQTLGVNAPACPEFQLAIDIFAVGNVNLSGLQSIAPTAPHGVTFNVAGMVFLGSLTTADATSFDVLDTASIVLPSLTTLRGGDITVVSGQLTANALTEASGVSILAAHDAAIVMNALTTYRDGNIFLNAGHITLPSLTTLFNVTMQILEGALLDVPQLTTYSADVTGSFLTGGILQAPALRNLTNVNLGVAEGTRTMSLPGVTSYSWTLCEGLGLGSILAGGGGTIDLSGVQTFTIDVPGCGMLAYNIGAVTAGMVDLSGLTTIVMPGPQTVGILAANPGSVIDLSSLRTFPVTKVLFLENDSGRIIRPAGGGGGGGGAGFDDIRASLATLRAGVGGDGLDRTASRKLGKLLTKAEKKLASAAAGDAAGKTKRVTRGLKQTRAALLRFVTLVQRLQPKHIADPLVGAALSTAAAQALQEVEALQAAAAG